jgi:hypothetical protein
MNMNQYLIMRPKSFAIVAMLVIAAALMSSIIPSGDLEHAYAEESDYSQDNDSEENGNTEHESDHDENNDDDARSQDDDGEDSDDENNDDDENGDEGDSSETGTEQENDQKNVCSGWAVCINEAANAEDSVSIVGGADAASIANEIPMELALPL